MKLSDELTWRGLIKDKTLSNLAWLDEPKSFYHGVDASSDSLTIGNLAALLMAKRLQAAGWRTIILVGGGTSLIGDPGGKETERELKDPAEIKANAAAIQTQLEKLFAGQPFSLVNNQDWLSDLKLLDFLREIGKHFSMTELMQRDFIAERMGEGGSGISYAEFSYSLIQGYDFWNLYKNYQTVLQIGGSDQWGNMLSGVALIRKKEGAEAHALSMPLVVDKISGRKFGKSEAGAIWLAADKTSPTQFYQFWINTDDSDVEDYLKIFTFLPGREIDQIIRQHQQSPGGRQAQQVFARQVTALVHGSTAISVAEGITKYLTSQVSMATATADELTAMRQAIPSISVSAGSSIISALVRSGLTASNSEARRLLSNGAIYINGNNVAREAFQDNDFQNGRLLLRRGKAYKDSALIELSQGQNDS